MNSKTQVAFANEGAEKKQKEEEVAARKRKLEEKEKWEGKSYSASHIYLYCEILRGFSHRYFAYYQFSTNTPPRILIASPNADTSFTFPIPLSLPICPLYYTPLPPNRTQRRANPRLESIPETAQKEKEE